MNRKGLRWAAGALLSFLCGTAGFAVGTVELLYQAGAPASQTALGDLYGGDPFRPPLPASVSADGRYAVFLSGATNLVSGQRDINGVPNEPGEDVFLADLSTGAVTLVSHAMGQPATAGNRGSNAAVISADGRWVAFTSAATDLAPGQPAGPPFPFPGDAVLLYDRVSDTTTLVASTTEVSTSFGNLAVSADGRYLAFDSDAPGLVTGGHPPQSRAVYLYDRTDRSLRLVSHLPGAPLDGPAEYAGTPRMSADGRYVVFESGSADLLPGQITGFSALLYDRATGALSLVGLAGTADISADGAVIAYSRDSELRLQDRASGASVLVTGLAEAVSFAAQRAYSLSADGRYLAFLLLDQIAGEVHPMPMVYDRISHTATPVSRASATPPGFVDSPRISADGRLVVFGSADSGWVAGQSGQGAGIYLFDRAAGKTSLVSHAASSLTTLGNGASYSPAIAAGGSRAVYLSRATDLVAGLADLNLQQDLFAAGTGPLDNHAVTLRAADSPSLAPVADSRASAISADGRWVAFERATPGLGAGQVDVLLYDTVAKTTLLVDHTRPSATTPAKGESFAPVFSADGRYVAFYSNARNLVPGANPSGAQSLFLFDRITGTVAFVAPTGFPYGARDERVLPRPALSADGRWLAFVSDAPDVVPGQQEGGDPFSDSHDVFLYDRDSRAITLVSHSISGATVTGDRDSYAPLLSADGRWVVFVSAALDLLPGLVREDFDTGPGAFLYDRVTGALTLLTHRRSDPKTVSDLYSQPQMSADGRYVALATAAGDLDPSVPDHGASVYIYDRAAGSYQEVATAGPSSDVRLAFSANGRILAYPAFDGLTFYDRVTRTSSKAAGVIPEDFEPFTLSADGRYALFPGQLASLVPGLIRLTGWEDFDLFRYDRVAGTAVLVNQWRGSAVTTLGYASDDLLMSADGQRIAFTSQVDLVAGDYNRQSDAYLFTADGGAPGGPVTLPPCNLFNGALRSGARKALAVAGACGVPAGAKQVLLKLTVSRGTGKGNVQLYPGNVTSPSSGILRFNRGAVRGAGFTVSLGNGGIALLPFVNGNGTVRVAVEIDGYTP